MVGQAEVEQVHDGGQPGVLAGGERLVPQRPVVGAGGGLGQPPRHPVAEEVDAEAGHVGEVPGLEREVAAGGELVDPDVDALVGDDRIGGLLADHDGEGRERLHRAHCASAARTSAARSARARATRERMVPMGTSHAAAASS